MHVATLWLCLRDDAARATDHRAGPGCFYSDQGVYRVAGRCIVTAHRPDNERIVITGMGVASCFGNDVDTFYDS